ncbi:MAG: GNAT family N-acetyltransferase [Sphingobacteriaceae bacterium]|nr:GNAT family N-acetyltransferase [Cytophagaceae bacterium]
MPVYELQRDGFTLSTDPARLQILVIHEFLSQHSYWAEGIPLEMVQRSIENSLCFGLYLNTDQVGFARVISDQATFAYLADVFILPEFRGRGLSKWLVACILQHPNLQGLRRWLLATADAHALYAQAGFAPLDKAERWMEVARPGIYQNLIT